MARAYGPTLRINRLLAEQLPPEDPQDVEDARRGFVGTIEGAEVRRADGGLAWTMDGYGFLDDDEPSETVNPSLWRQARLNRLHGLFEVTPRIWQVRGLDIANITFIEGERGLIALDALTVPETARRVRQRIGTVLDWAHAKGYRDAEAPMRSVTRGLPKQPKVKEHFAAMAWHDVPGFLVKLAETPQAGEPVVVAFDTAAGVVLDA